VTKKIFFTPGPSELYPTLSRHMISALEQKVGAISHRGKQFQNIYAHAVSGLRTLLNIPDNYQVFFLASATEIWERILQNCVAHTSFHCVNGSFSKRFHEFAGELGLRGIKEEAGFGKGFYPDNITVPPDAEIICLTHNETSSGVAMPVTDINKFRRKKDDALIFVDSVSSLPYPEFDYSQIDSTYFSVQKCFGMPAGLGVWILNEKCIERAENLLAKGKSIGTYHSIPSILSKARINQTPETPNVLFLYLLGKITEEMNQAGISAIRKETDEKAKLIYGYLSSSSNFSPAVEDRAHRSQTTIVANTKMQATEVNKILEPFDLAVGSGYGNYKEQQIRIANFPAHSLGSVQLLIEKLQTLVG
jgi:phosphoserine aminotransferase